MTLQAKNLDTPDEKLSFEHGDIHLVHLPGATIGRGALNPGWRWSKDVKPIARTDSCQVAHTAYLVSGRLHVRMDDGSERELVPGDAHVVGPGHDAWVVGDEPCVTIDFAGGSESGRAGSVGRCPCGVEFRVNSEDALDHLVAAIQEHASASHGHTVTREHVLSELTRA